MLLGGVEVQVLASARGVRARDLPLGALALEDRVLEDLAVARAAPEDDPGSLGIASDTGALGAEATGALVELLARDEAKVRVLAVEELADGREQARGGRGVLLPDLGLGALVEHDQDAPVQRGAGLVLDRVEHYRGLDLHTARDVDERAALPLRRVARGEDVLRGADDRAEVLVDELRVLLHRL